MADICGVSGPGRRRHLQRVQFLPRRTRRGGKVPEFSQFTTGHARLQHRLEQHRAEHRRGVAAERAERLAAHAARRSRAGDASRRLLGRVRAAGHGRSSPGQFGANPGSTLSLTRNASTGHRRPRRIMAGAPARDRTGCTTRRSRTAPTFPIALRPNRADNIERRSTRTSRSRRRARGPSSFQRSLSKDMAVDVRYVGTRGVNQWSRAQLQRAEPHRERLPRRVQARDGQPAGEQRRRAARRAGSFAYFGPGTGTNPLPIYLAYLNG